MDYLIGTDYCVPYLADLLLHFSALQSVSKRQDSSTEVLFLGGSIIILLMFPSRLRRHLGEFQCVYVFRRGHGRWVTKKKKEDSCFLHNGKYCTERQYGPEYVSYLGKF